MSKPTLTPYAHGREWMQSKGDHANLSSAEAVEALGYAPESVEFDEFLRGAKSVTDDAGEGVRVCVIFPPLHDPDAIGEAISRAIGRHRPANAPSATLDHRALQLATLAYDAERCRLNELWHGGRCAPMSEANAESIRPMIGAAIAAYLDNRP